MCFIFKRNTSQLAAAGIKGIRIQFGDVSDYLVPFPCGGALHAPSACCGVRSRRLTKIMPSIGCGLIFIKL